MTTPTPDQGSEEPAADYIEPPTRKLARETLRKVVVALNRPDDGSDAQEPWSIIEDAIKASPNKAVATTPTPDQRALERARALYETTAHFYAIDRLWIHNIAAALTAAEAKGRAAALEHAELLLLRHRDRLRSSNGADMKLAAHEIDTCAEAIRALATPAPEEKT